MRDRIEAAAPTAPSFEALCKTTGAAVTCFGCALEVEEIYGKARPGAVDWSHKPTLLPAKKLLGLYRSMCRAIGSVPIALYRQAGWYVNRPELRTRLVTCHLPLPGVKDYLEEPALVEIVLHDPDGRRIARKTQVLPFGHTLAVEIADLFPAATHGLVVWRFVQPQLGSGRSYLQWYSDGSATSTHEKLWGKGEGYFAIPKVPTEPDLDIHWITVNPMRKPFRAEFVLTDGGRELERKPFELAPRASQFQTMDEIFPGFRAKGENLTVYLDGDNGRIFCYYLVHNRTIKTWQAQHL